MSIISGIKGWFTKEINGVKRYVLYGAAVGKAALHGGWSSITSVIGASILDYSKFNLTNGLRSELDLLILVFLSSGGLAAYLYVKQNAVPKQ
jgi:hypothetical protein